MSQLTTQGVLEIFGDIASIPRPPKYEEKIRSYIIEWARNRSYNYAQDTYGNLVVYAPAQDNPNKATIALQSHLDMVCVSDEGVDYDPLRSPIQLEIRDGVLSAKGTTLGADDGIGVALALASADLITRPNLELIFTVEEEIGLQGAAQIDPALIHAKTLINLDNETNHEICLGTAGLAIFQGVHAASRSPTSKGSSYMFRIFGLRGGHSGVDIHRPHGNAILLTAQLLSEYSGEYKLGYFNGGVADNAIPSTTTCELLLDDPQGFEMYITTYLEKCRSVYDAPNLNYTLSPLETMTYTPLKDHTTLLQKIISGGTGVVEHDTTKPGSVVTTSYNLAIMHTLEDSIDVIYSARSTYDAAMLEILDHLTEVYSGKYKKSEILHTGWLEDESSYFVQSILHSMRKIHPGVYTSTIHAGLETSVLEHRIEGISAVSIGPTIDHVHSTAEQMRIDDIGLYCEYLRQILADCACE